MGDDAQDDQTQDRQDKSSKGIEQKPPDDLWRLALGMAELGCLYFAYKQGSWAASLASSVAGK